VRTTAENRELVLEAWKVVDTGQRLDELNRYFAPDYVRHSDADDYSLEELGEILKTLREAFPDFATRTEDMIAEGDRVAYRWVSTGTHLGPYMGMPPTKKQLTAGGINIARIGDDGRIAEEWSSWSKVSFLQALGIIPIS
jgi:steroid delta-isomerase-like uncharacterized protein